MNTANESSPVEILPAPVISTVGSESDKWYREYRAFLSMLPDLLRTHPEKVVAVHEGKVVCEGSDVVDVALHAYRQYGYVPIYVGPVTAPPAVERLPNPRSLVDSSEFAFVP